MEDMNLIDVIVNFFWDEEANVWVATSEKIPGLVLESESFDVLEKRVIEAVPELLSLNGLPSNIILDFHTNKREMVYA